jgi:beta-glucanase (GH16 family)
VETPDLMRLPPRTRNRLNDVRRARVARLATCAALTALIFAVAPTTSSSALVGVSIGSTSLSLSLGVRSDPTTTTTTTSTTTTTTTTTTTIPSTTTTTTPPPSIQYPDGTPDASNPSGESPPSPTALSGYQQSYVKEFDSTSSLKGWTVFQGPTTGDPGGEFVKTHVVVSGDLLQLNAWQDPNYDNAWATGGVCQCNVNNTYGAYFVRSRLTGPGPTAVEMLMPENGWPPEIDFNETRTSDDNTIATLHYSSSDIQIYRQLTIDLTKWHTWGVVWTPTSITYTVDGHAWGSITVPSEIPDQPMHLDLTSQTWCSSGFACPTQRESSDIAWVAEYKPSVGKAPAIGPFAKNSVALTTPLKTKIANLAVEIKNQGDTTVNLIGYGEDSRSIAQSRIISRVRALNVARYLRVRLSALGVTGVTITATGKAGTASLLVGGAVPVTGRRVVPWIT